MPDTVSQGTQPIAVQRSSSGLGPPPRVAMVVLVAAATVWTVLVAAAWLPLMVVDNAVVQASNALVAPRPELVVVVELVTDIGHSLAVQLLTGIVVVCALIARRYRVAAYVLVGWLVEYVVENGLKELIGRVRPVVPDELVHVTSGSYPSGHAMSTTAIAVTMVVVMAGLVDRRWWRVLLVVGAAVVVLAVAASRVLIGAHYPSDVVGGVLLGVLVALVLLPIAGLPAARSAAVPAGARQV